MNETPRYLNDHRIHLTAELFRYRPDSCHAYTDTSPLDPSVRSWQICRDGLACVQSRRETVVPHDEGMVMLPDYVGLEFMVGRA